MFCVLPLKSGSMYRFQFQQYFYFFSGFGIKIQKHNNTYISNEIKR